MKGSDCSPVSFCLDFIQGARQLFRAHQHRGRVQAGSLGQVVRVKEGEDPQYHFDLDIHELLLQRIQQNALNVRLFSEETPDGWSSHGIGTDLFIIADPFDQSATSARGFHMGAVALCVLDSRFRFKACAIGDLSTELTYLADESGARLIENAVASGAGLAEFRVVDVRPSQVRSLNEAWVVVPGMCPKRRSSACRSHVTQAASRWLNLDGVLNLASLASGGIDAYLDPFVGQPIYEIVCAELACRAGAVVTDSRGTPFNLEELVQTLLANTKARYPIVAAATEPLHREILLCLAQDQRAGLHLATTAEPIADHGPDRVQQDTRFGTDQKAGAPIRTEPLSWELPGAHWMGGQELDAVSKVIAARSPFRFHGPAPQHMADRLEQAYCQRLGRKFALAVGSGTAALQIALGSLRIGPGDEVLLPGYLWVSCLSAIVRVGAIPRLVDIDDTFCLDPQDLERKLSPRSKAVLLIHMSGATGDVDRVIGLARHHGLAVIEDCAQANGGSYGGRPVGSFGDLAIFSFQANKIITSGEGGLMVCDDEALFKRCFALHDLGYARDETGLLDPSDANFQLWGLGTRMSEITAAVLLAQLEKIDNILAELRQRKRRIRDVLQKVPGLGFRRIPDLAGDTGAFLITRFSSSTICQRFCEAMRAEGIRGPAGSLAFIPMSRWGLHWYFENRSLVKRSGVWSDGYPWTHPLNAFAAQYSYERGALPVCDSRYDDSALLAIAACRSQKDEGDVIAAYQKAARDVLNP